VRALIQEVHPKTVFLEYCNARCKIREERFERQEEYLRWKDMRRKDIEESRRYLAYKLSQLLGKEFVWADEIEESAKKIYESFNVFQLLPTQLLDPPNCEFLAAAEVAAEIDANVILGDRDQGITFKRLLRGLSVRDWFRINKRFFGVRFNRYQSWKNYEAYKKFEDFLEASEKLGDFLDPDLPSSECMKKRKIGDDLPSLIQKHIHPWPIETLIRERDQLMTLGLEQVVHSPAGKEASDPDMQGDVVAVVGLGHLTGMNRNWEMLERRRIERGHPTTPEELKAVQDKIDVAPGMLLSSGKTYTLKELRAHVAERVDEIRTDFADELSSRKHVWFERVWAPILRGSHDPKWTFYYQSRQFLKYWMQRLHESS
jgi:hypothetical protein